MKAVSQDASLRDIARLLFRHKGKMLLAACTVLALTAGYIGFVPRLYRSESKILVRLGRENASLDPTATGGQGSVVVVPSTRDDDINSVIEVLKSRVLMEQLVDKFGPATILEGGSPHDDSVPAVDAAEAVAEATPAPLDAELPFWQRISPLTEDTPRDAAIAKLTKRLTIAAAKKTNLISISFDSPSPELSQALTAALVESFLEQHVKWNRTPGALDFFAEQTQQLSRQLEEAETKLRDLKTETGLAAVDEQRRLLVTRAAALEDQVLATETEFYAVQAEATKLTEQLQSLPETLVTATTSNVPNPGADSMRQQLYLLQLKEQELLSTFREETPQVKEVRRQIKEAQSILAGEERVRSQASVGINKNREQVQMSLLQSAAKSAALDRRRQLLDGQLGDARTELKRLNDDSLRISRLERDAQLLDSNYRRHAASLEQTRIDAALQNERISNLSVVQPASLQAQLVRPNKLLSWALGAALAIVAAATIALTAEFFDRSLKTEEDVAQRLGIPALISIPRMRGRDVAVNVRNVAP